MVLRRGFGLAPGQRVVVVEDVVTTGKSTREVIAVLESFGGEALGVASLVNRSGDPRPFAPLPSCHLVSANFKTWSAGDCPLCRSGVPIAKPGSRPIT
jgi:orotate phosphoribosyltransferase